MKKIESLDEMVKILKTDILHKPGNIMINVNGIPKVSKSNDIIGNCLQEWLPQWFRDNGLDLEANQKTQTFPDFIAHFNDHTEMVDIKCWNYKNSPAFDIANFDSFYSVVYNNPAKIFAKYLTIGYTPVKYGFTIDYVGLKSIDQLLGPSSKYPITIQVKRKRPYAIRPINFVKRPDKSFNNLLEVVNAVKETRLLFPSEDISYSPEDWYKRVVEELKREKHE